MTLASRTLSSEGNMKDMANSIQYTAWTLLLNHNLNTTHTHFVWEQKLMAMRSGIPHSGGNISGQLVDILSSNLFSQAYRRSTLSSQDACKNWWVEQLLHILEPHLFTLMKGNLVIRQLKIHKPLDQLLPVI